MKQTLVKLFGVAVLSGLLLGCKPPPPTIFGVSPATWKSLTPSERKQVIQGYNQTQSINASNAPINNAIGAANTYEQQHQWEKQQNQNWQKMNTGLPKPFPN